MSPSLDERHALQLERAEAHGQTHVFAHWDGLDEAAQGALLGELEAVDYDLMARLAALLVGDPASSSPELSAPELFPLERDGALEARASEATARGAECLAAGKVGFMIVAGGQGSRLGFDGPKGCFEIGPVTRRSLFEWHARRVLAAGRRHSFTPAWYVMTSPANDGPTRAFFAEHDHFGLGADNVFFFSQAMLPAMDLEGRLLMTGPGRLFLAPNGHGGSLAALATSGALADMRARGIETISYFQVDNPLARPGDALFLGLHTQAGAGMSSKVVSKRDAGEKVGVLGLIDGVLGCIEYSDLSEDLRVARSDDGQLLFRAGNIAVHALDVGFVEGLTTGGNLDLPWHIARKRMAVLASDGSTTEVEGAKFETFVFDALGKSPASVTLEVDRAVEFSPVKNKDGSDSADSCRRDLTSLFTGWLGRGGLEPGDGFVEIDPLFAEDGDEFE
ncbi:MAG: UTP--glucose-1-phosphate uridylyltransferase, partial [Planctomycetota bacterium]|nr:UTP--glucose-1-phosphate uridylyltransferase [Planctomycetota bacterium]